MEGSTAPHTFHTETLLVPVAAVIVDGDRQALVVRSTRPQQRCARKDLSSAHPEATPGPCSLGLGLSCHGSLHVSVFRILLRSPLWGTPSAAIPWKINDFQAQRPSAFFQQLTEFMHDPLHEQGWWPNLLTIRYTNMADNRIYSWSVTRTRLMTEFTHDPLHEQGWWPNLLMVRYMNKANGRIHS